MKKIYWERLCSTEEALHVSYSSQSKGGSWQMHGHDFCEVFWVESGIGRHLVDGLKDPCRLVSGQMCFIRDKDCHGFEAETGIEPFACINIAFPVAAWEQIRRRYGLEHHPFLNSGCPFPPLLEAPADMRSDFSRFFFRVLRRAPDILSRDAFLLGLATRTGGMDLPAPQGDLPAWLRRGMMAFEHEPALWSKGASELARCCGCSLTHLARIFREHLDRTPSDWILELRLVRASRLMQSTGFSVTEVALESGFENLSYFHRCFSHRFGQSPLQFRKSTRREAF